MSNYYRLREACKTTPTDQDYMLLTEPVDHTGHVVSGNSLMIGKQLDLRVPVLVPVLRTGRTHDIIEALGGIFVVSRRCRDIISNSKVRVQFIPAEIQGLLDYSILNLLLSIERNFATGSSFDLPTNRTNVIVVERSCICQDSTDMFRWLQNGISQVICSERLRDAMKEASITGVGFESVCVN